MSELTAAILAAATTAATTPKAHKRETETLGTVWIRALTGDQLDAMEAYVIDNPSGHGLRGWVLARGLCEEDGSDLGFNVLTDAAILGKLPGKDVEALYWDIMQLSGRKQKAVVGPQTDIDIYAAVGN